MGHQCPMVAKGLNFVKSAENFAFFHYQGSLISTFQKYLFRVDLILRSAEFFIDFVLFKEKPSMSSI